MLGGGRGEIAMPNDDTKVTSDSALMFWSERGESAGDRAWRAWRHDLEALIAILDAHRARSAEDTARLVAMKAEAEARVAFHEAETARLGAVAELADAAFEKRIHELRGGRLQ
jgi:hypothetical protein